MKVMWTPFVTLLLTVLHLFFTAPPAGAADGDLIANQVRAIERSD